MAWTVRFAAAAEKTLVKLDPPVARRIVRKLEEVAAGDPRRTGEAMQGDERAWRYRIGDWRIICDLADASRIFMSFESAIVPMSTAADGP